MLPNLSYRYKFPLALMAVILLTEMVITATLVNRALADARRDLEISAQGLARALTRSVRDQVARDDLWHTYEAIRTPIAARDPANPLKDIIVVDLRENVYAATDPVRFPVLTPMQALPTPYRDAVTALERNATEFYFGFPGLFAHDDVTAGMQVRSDDGSALGYLLISYDGGKFYQRIRSTLLEIAVVSIPGLLLLISLGWVAGKRLADPLLRLSEAMRKVGREPAEKLLDAIPAAGNDEIGQLSAQFRAMLEELAEKQSLEREMIVAERLAAVGRVAAGVAHEINNPLGGMINAVDTITKHGNPDPLTRKTLGLLERGLSQIRATVNALLVEARIGSPALSPQDWDDLRLLIEPQVRAKGAHLDWSAGIDRSVDLPAHLVRQLVLNLLLNATTAVEPGGTICCQVTLDNEGQVSIQVTNTGDHISGEAMGRLFEPFNEAAVASRGRARGFGLWVSYQIVTQLGGTISVTSEPGMTVFNITLAVPVAREAAA